MPTIATPAPAISCFMPWLFAPGLSLPVTFQEVNDAPHAETGTEGDNEGLENGDCLIEKFHK